MKFSLKLVHKLGVWESDINEANEEEYETVVEFVEQAAKGKTSYFNFQNKGVEYYFPEDIIKQSIILIIKH